MRVNVVSHAAPLLFRVQARTRYRPGGMSWRNVNGAPGAQRAESVQDGRGKPQGEDRGVTVRVTVIVSWAKA